MVDTPIARWGLNPTSNWGPHIALTVKKHAKHNFTKWRSGFISPPEMWGSLDFSKGAITPVCLSSPSSGCSGPHLDPNTCQRERQTQCQKECQKECQNRCQIECQNICQIECRKKCNRVGITRSKVSIICCSPSIIGDVWPISRLLLNFALIRHATLL